MHLRLVCAPTTARYDHRSVEEAGLIRCTEEGDVGYLDRACQARHNWEDPVQGGISSLAGLSPRSDARVHSTRADGDAAYAVGGVVCCGVLGQSYQIVLGGCVVAPAAPPLSPPMETTLMMTSPPPSSIGGMARLVARNGNYDRRGVADFASSPRTQC